MKLAFIQPPYPNKDKALAMNTMQFMLDRAREVEEGTDLLVLPEYANCPGIDDYEEMLLFIRCEGAEFLSQLYDVAKRKRCHLALNIVRETEIGLMNTTLWIDRTGQVIAAYDKVHLTETERSDLRFIPGQQAKLIEVEGIKVAFATCFDLYFAEYFEKIAALQPNLLIIPTYQRSESSEVLRIQALARAMDTGCHIVRCSYSMGAASVTGGMSMLVHPRGEVLCSAEQEPGLFMYSTDVKEQWMRNASYGQDKKSARSIVEANRCPQLYRKAGPGVSAPAVKSPAIVAHRGYSKLCPENTMPSFGAAIALGVDEIELDIRCSKDGRLIVIHDEKIDRTTDATGFVRDYTWDELKTFDVGSWLSPSWKGVTYTLFDDVLDKYAGQVRINTHLKETGEDGYVIRQIKALAERYDMVRHIYIAGNREVLADAIRYAPEFERCCLVEQASWNLVDHAIEYRCGRLQFINRFCNEEMIQRAHDAGIRCNLFYSDDTDEAIHFFKMGIDAVLTNDPLKVMAAVRRLEQ